MGELESKNLVAIKDLTKKYGSVTVLDRVNVNFSSGEIHALIGENGAGKSTLCKMIAGAIAPESGKIVVDGKEHDCLTPIEAKNAGISMVYQEFNLIPELSVWENLFVGKEIKKGLFVERKAMISASKKLFDSMGVKIDCEQKIKDISVAYCQLVEIAKALLDDSKLLIMDEPTAPLTNAEVEILFKLLNNLRSKGICIIYISHRLEEVFRLCDRITVLRDGQLVQTMDTSDTTMEELIKLMIGRELSQEFPDRIKNSDAEEKPVIMKVEGLTTSKIKDISFNLYKGEILGIAGLVGSGRSEVVRAIFGADKKESGSVFVKGKLAKINSPISAIKNGISLIPEDRKREGLMLILPIRENMSIVVIKQLSKILGVSRKNEHNLVKTGIEQFRIKVPSCERPVSSLSGGNQQKIVLSKWLASNGDILLLDEPTRGIDVGAKKEIYDFLLEFKAQGKSIIMISSEMPEILGLCDRMIVLHEGRLQGELNYEEATQEKVLRLASGLK